MPGENFHLAYYLWRFPTLSETFIQRDVAGLRKTDLSVEVVADAPDDLKFLDNDAQALLRETSYLLPMDRERLRRYTNIFY